MRMDLRTLAGNTKMFLLSVRIRSGKPVVLVAVGTHLRTRRKVRLRAPHQKKQGWGRGEEEKEKKEQGKKGWREKETESLPTVLNSRSNTI